MNAIAGNRDSLTSIDPKEDPMTMRHSLALTLVLILTSLAGCASASSPKQPDTAQPAPSPSPSAAPAAKSSGRKSASQDVVEIRCTLAKDERIIMLQPDSPGCEVYYTRPGEPEAKIVASAKHGLDHCRSVVERMRTNLTNSGFACK